MNATIDDEIRALRRRVKHVQRDGYTELTIDEKSIEGVLSGLS